MNPCRAHQRTCGEEVRVAVWELSAASRRVAVEVPPAAVQWRPAVVVDERKPRPQAASRRLQGVSSLPPILNGHPYTLTVERRLAILADENLAADGALPACNLCR